MKMYPICLIALVILALPVLALAAPFAPGAYVSAFVGMQVPANTDASSTDYFTGNSFYDRVEFDPGINIGGTGGYDFGVVRLEGELSYKNAEIKSVADQTSGSRFRNTDGDLGVLAMMFNGFINLRNNTPVTPYLGGGIGFAAMHLSDTFGVKTSGGTTQRLLLYGAGDDTVFAYQVGGGLDVALNRRFSLDIGYRYFSTNRANFDSDQNISSSLKYESHAVAVGFRWSY